MKIAITGNSGSGKTWLAKRLCPLYSARLVHLDHLFWEPGGFDKKRSPGQVALLVQESKTAPSWVVEGVFGELVRQYLDEADLFIWLDLDWPVCKKRLEKRGSESKKHMGRKESAEGLGKLMVWASQYYIRRDLRSYAGHKALLDGFSGEKVRLESKGEVTAFLDLKLKEMG